LTGGCETSGAAFTGVAGDTLRIPGDTRVDIGVVDPCGTNADQDFILARPWDRNIGVVLELVETAVSGQQYSGHGIGYVTHHPEPPLKQKT